ncbi:WD40 repeat domain-containing protein [Phormidium sp. CCY1219]|uniref:WD40 repeat domain-containing protein n=1 Tax=Phormidium sp. CCY1219 TaxID=2886104 RepID=UPI002D1EE3F9|nr:WD40 repeat domain-containing protein [Phormidium sp. CCY1219]MEB3831764.1 WD40 repeat domain-containing protein [Phormidium sp. CCY1219]
MKRANRSRKEEFEGDRVIFGKRINLKIMVLAAIALVIATGFGIYFFRFQTAENSSNIETADNSEQPKAGTEEESARVEALPAYASAPQTPEGSFSEETFVRQNQVTLELETVLSGSDWSVHDLALTPDGQTVIASDYSSVQIWQIDPNCTQKRTCLPSQQLDNASLWVYSVAISPNRKLLATGTWKQINLFDLATGEPRGDIFAHLNAVDTLLVSPDGEILFSGSSDKTIKLWSLARATRLPPGSRKQTPLTTLEGHEGAITTLAISGDGQTLVSGSSDKTIKIWKLDRSSGVPRMESEPITLVGHENAVRSVAISPDGEIVASGSLDKTIKIWNLKTGKLMYELPEDSATVLSVSISPDGELLASGGADNRIKLWRIDTGELLNIVEAHSAPVKSLGFSAGGNRLVSGSSDKTIKIWRVGE